MILAVKALLAVLFAYAIFLHHGVSNRWRLYPNALNLFLIYQGLGFLGTLILADFVYQGDRIRTATMFVGLLSVLAGGVLATLLSHFSPRAELAEFQTRSPINDLRGAKMVFVLVPITFVSIAVGIVYVNAMGYNLPLELLRAYKSGGGVSGSAAIYGSLRTSVWTDSSRYIAPGYAAQFMKILLPAASFMWFVRGRLMKSRWQSTIAATLAVATLYLLAATGIRSYLIVFTAMFAVIVSTRYGPFGECVRLNRRLVILLGAVAVVLLGLLTALGGRSKGGGSLGGNIVAVAWDLVERLVLVTAEVQLGAMRILAHQPQSWGTGWIEGFAVLLPGSMPTQSSRIYELLYGGAGNAPLDLWTSLWIEFGWTGILTVSMTTGFLLQRLHIRTLRGPKLLTRTVLLTMAPFTLIIISDPISLFNNGLITLLIFLTLFRVVSLAGGFLRPVGSRAADSSGVA